MNYNKFIPILGLMLLFILAIGSISAAEADMDSTLQVDNIADIDSPDEGQSVDKIADSNIREGENAGEIIADSGDDEEISDDVGSIGDVKKEVGVKDSLGASPDNDILASTIKFKEGQYSTYFNGSGNIISGKLHAGDTLDFSGTFNKKMFIINIPLTITCTDGTVQLIDCGFSFINGSSGSNISNIKARQISVSGRSIIEAHYVNDLNIFNNDLFSNQTGSHPMSFGNVLRVNVFNNKLQCNAITDSSGWGQPSAMVFRNSGNCNISGNTVITNDSNGIYFSGYGAATPMGGTPEDGSFANYIFNNTVYSIRELPSSFCYGIQLMCKDNLVLNNTVYNTFRGISATAAGNQIIGNIVHNIHGAYYSQATEEQGGDFAIFGASNSVVRDNLIYDCHFNLREGEDSMTGAISVGKNSVVSNNTVRNCNSVGIKVDGNNVSISNNSLNLSGYGVHIYGGKSDIYIESNVIDSNNYNTIKILKQSNNNAPHDITIQNNTLYSTSEDGAIYKDKNCTNILESQNIIIGTSGEPVIDNETLHIINENNFYKYFSTAGSFNTYRIKENDTIIFTGNFSSKGKLNINEKVIIQGVNALFKDTTFIISEIDDVIFENVSIDNPNTNLADRLWGIQISNSNRVTIRNCNISIYDPNSAFAIYVLDSKDCNIINNILEAEGNYFTAAIISFNSTNLNVTGNSLKTIGSGEVYLVNNRSCLDGYLNYYSNEGTFVCPDGYTICPDGSIVCPDGATINAEDYRICVDGSIVCTDGSIICPDGSVIGEGATICPDGSICVDGVTYCLDGTLLYENGDKLVAGGYLICVDGSITCPDGSIIGSGEYEVEDATGNYICPDGTVICPDGKVICLDGSTVCPDGSIICPDGTTICADGTTICPDGSIVCADGTQICPDGSIVCADGTVYGPGEYTIDENGNYVCPDGTTIICPDGSGSSSGTILDGVIPGTHMVSGLYRTYGFLMVHSSNVLFANNSVEVTSALGNDYNLNESYNTIAGVFVHYGGFNNTITNNSIVLASNDPIIYGIGIVGAPLNSTAIGSANNTFTYNNISIRGKYISVGLLLGNKAIDSDIEYNRFYITFGKPSPNIVNYNTSAPNVIENNEFFTTLGTEFSFDNVVVTVQEAKEGTVLFKAVLKDREGNVLSNKPVSFTFNNKIINCTTDENGIAYMECDVKAIGTYEISMRFNGDDEYFESSDVGTITVRKVKTSISVSNASYKTTAATKTIKATLKDENGVVLKGKTIKFVVNGVTYTGTTDANGVASVKVNLNAGGTYTISASFVADSEYEASSASGTLTLTKQSTALTASGVTYAVTNTGKYVTVTLKDGDKKLVSGKKITATVNGKTFSATTNSKGVAKIKLTLSAVKTFTVSLKFAGDSTYTASSKSIKVKVTKTKTKLTVPKKTYKKAAKTKKLTATLKDSTGKVIKSKKVTFTVNGKKYSAKTNSKGVVTVKVKLSKKKTYKVTVKFAGDSKYLAVTKNGKVVIK